ncbi:peptidoglycan bridge formation glycyltransferase FemA/FemB family protein [Candidatus Saccharibacteria bacterium]|nr:peptidoglycan bridge formation glycyltransferase FemA/FemB family protein [Candidatus Saccharibacteria bacterium]
MNFEEITAEDFRAYAETSPYKSFMQTPEIASLREKSGWTPHYVAVKKDGEIIAASLLVSKPAFLKKLYFYAPGGPLIDLEDTKLVNFFFEKLKSFIKSKNGYFLHIDPYYELIERDRDGLPVEGGFNRKKALKTLENLGFKEMKNASQPKYLFIKPIETRTETELMESFKRNTRNHIRKAEKMGVTVRELNREELDKFKGITESTSERRHFTDKPLSYYETMYDLFHDRGEVKFMVAEADIEGKITVLSAAMFMTYGKEVIYLFSGSDEKYMREYNAQYLIQYHMIKFAAENNFNIYNFYGINGLPDENSKDYGIYDFKKGFGGHVVELIGSFELSLSKTYTLAKKIRH